MKESKMCPKCQGTEIYCDAGMTKSGERGYIPVSSWSKMFLDVYLCITCGYLEEYMQESDLKTEKIRAKLKENWRKI